MIYVKKYEAFNNLDPYGEENWDDDNNDIYVIYVLGQDANFLAKKEKGYKNRRGVFIGYKFIIATKENNHIHFNGFNYIRDPFSAKNVEDILNGKELVGYITGINKVKFDTLQNLCNIIGIPMNNIKMYHF